LISRFFIGTDDSEYPWYLCFDIFSAFFWKYLRIVLRILVFDDMDDLREARESVFQRWEEIFFSKSGKPTIPVRMCESVENFCTIR
jgi:hypothetical protein